MKNAWLRLPVLVFLLAVSGITFWGCGTTETASAKAIREHTEAYKLIDDSIILGYLNRHRIVNYTRTTSGLYLINKTAGTGPFIKTGQIFNVKYIGRLLGYGNEGKVFESTYDNHLACQCGTFVAGQQITGWNEGVQLMQAGSQKTLLIPSYMAYGIYGSGSIGADQPLLFEMEIVSIAP